MKDLGIIIQARTGSTRLPNKMILPFYFNQGILEILLQRLKESELGVKIIVATTMNSTDDVIVDIAQKYDCLIFRGEQDDVLSRFVEAAIKNKISKVIRICADNPFLDIKSLENQINFFEKSKSDYLCYSLSNERPTILTHYGFWSEAVSLKALQKVQKATFDRKHIEHVTNYIYQNPDDFNIERMYVPFEIEKIDLRLTIDTREDFELASTIYKKLKDKEMEINIDNILALIEKNPTWIHIMKKQIIQNSK